MPPGPASPNSNTTRDGTPRLLAQVVELEAGAFLAGMREPKLPDGRDRLVRHGHGPERLIQTGMGLREVADLAARIVAEIAADHERGRDAAGAKALREAVTKIRTFLDRRHPARFSAPPARKQRQWPLAPLC
jgi:hypothetical protein